MFLVSTDHADQPGRRSAGTGQGPLVVLGAGGNVADILDIVDALAARGDAVEVKGLLDDNRPAGSMYRGLPVLGSLADSAGLTECRFLSSIRNEASHHRHARILQRLGLRLDDFMTLIDPRACVSARADVGGGVYICAAATVAAGVVIGNQASVGPGVAIGHDTELSDYAIVAAGAVIGGQVRVGPSVYVGSGATIMPGVRLGEGCLIGLGAVVVRDVDPRHVVVGNPARTLREQ